MVGWDVNASTASEYVSAIDEIAIHMITVKIDMKNLHLKGNPLVSNKIMLRDAMKPVVLKPRIRLYEKVLLSAIVEYPAI